MTRLSEQEVSDRRQLLAVATTQARALAREVHRLRAEILSGEADDGPDTRPDTRQLELPEVVPAPTPAPTLAQAEPASTPTLLERLTLAEPVRCLLLPIEEALSPGALELYRELHDRSRGRRDAGGLDHELVYEILAFDLVTTIDDETGRLVALEPSLEPSLCVNEPTDGDALETLARALEETGTVARLRDAVRLPTVVVRAGLRALEQMGVLELDGDRYARRVRVPAVENAVLDAVRLEGGSIARGAVVRAVSCPQSVTEWSLAALHEDGRVVVREGRFSIADTPAPLTEQQVDELVADEVGRSYSAPSSARTVARWTHLSASTVRSSLARLALAGRVQWAPGRSGEDEYRPTKQESAKAKAKPKPAKARGKPKPAKAKAKAKPTPAPSSPAHTPSPPPPPPPPPSAAPLPTTPR